MEVEEVDEDEDAYASVDPIGSDAASDPILIGSDAACGRRATITQPAKRQKVEEAAQAPMHTTETGGAPFITEAGGYKLILSSRSNTGYRGVCFARKTNPSRPFQMSYHKNGKMHYEYHKTAVEAAIAYARRLEAKNGQGEQEEDDEAEEAEAEEAAEEA